MTTNMDAAPLDGMTMALDASTHTTVRMSHPRQRIEAITGVERRRRWSMEQKQAIVLESLRPGVSVLAIARKHGVGTGQLYTWRRRLRGDGPSLAVAFAQVDLPRAAVADPSAPAAGAIEIVLPDGTNIRVDQTVDERALRRVLRVLRDR